MLTRKQIDALGAKKVPDLGEGIVFEFWIDPRNPNKDYQRYIKIKYVDKYLELGHCKEKSICSLREFRIMLKTRIYSNMDTICNMAISRKIDSDEL